MIKKRSTHKALGVGLWALGSGLWENLNTPLNVNFNSAGALSLVWFLGLRPGSSNPAYAGMTRRTGRRALGFGVATSSDVAERR